MSGKRVFVEVVTKELYCIEQSHYPKSWDAAKILSMWFSDDKINSSHAGRDGALVGSSKKLVCWKILKAAKDYDEESKINTCPLCGDYIGECGGWACSCDMPDKPEKKDAASVISPANDRKMGTVYCLGCGKRHKWKDGRVDCPKERGR